ncbi:hypothetical protein [Williamsia sp.]|uniref:hypothetical protein n=1 Tax=Williamsia sp. TaxID=1872085 RepID=UPI002F94D98E
MKLPLPSPKPLSDKDVAGLLHRSTGVMNLVLDVVDSDPFGVKGRTFRGSDQQSDRADEALVAKVLGTVDGSLVWAADATGLPGTAKWAGWTPAQRRDWWIGRVGALTTVGVAYPGVFGPLVNRLPVQTVLGFGNQALLLCAVARAYGIDDRYRQTDLLAEVLCRRTVDARALLTGEPGDGTDVLVSEMWSGIERSRAVLGDLERRPSSKQPWRMLTGLPLVGALAGYIGESDALRRASNAVVREVV